MLLNSAEVGTHSETEQTVQRIPECNYPTSVFPYTDTTQ